MTGVTDRVSKALACLVIDRQLAGALFWDLDPALIYPLARWLSRLVGSGPRVVRLGQKLDEESLWGQITFDSHFQLQWKPGPLAGYWRQPWIVVMPDVGLLSLPAARAAVTLVGADVAHLQRSGVSRMWHPRDWWLASLRRKDVGRISPHLLDRFAVRVDAGDLALPGDGGLEVLPAPSPAWVQAVQAVRFQPDRLPMLSDAAADRVLTLVPSQAPGVRRDLALGRLARALAVLAGDSDVLPGHVDSAAELAGLPTEDPRWVWRWASGGTEQPMAWPGPRGSAAAESSVALGGVTLAETGTDERTGPRATVGPDQPNGIHGHVDVVTEENPATLVPESAEMNDARLERPEPTALDGPYPEDLAAPRRDPAPLRLGWARALTAPQRGHQIGTQPARSKYDIAVAATLLTAARYQKQRCARHFQEGHRLHIYRSDLRSYRRAAQPRPLLVLLLDHTCRRQGWDWYQPLAPYLRSAYVTRALVVVVEVGADAKTSEGELQATQFRSRSLLDPRVATALGRKAKRGRATPLAHGLTVAAAMLRHDTQQGSGLVSAATLIVVTDGRANVPLADSQAGRLPTSAVGATAVDDTERAAWVIADLSRVSSVVVDPAQQPWGRFAVKLAKALDAKLVRGIPLPAFAEPELGSEEPDASAPDSGTL